MHVREIPGVIFEELVAKPQTINVREFAKSEWPISYKDEDYRNHNLIVGAVGESVLRVDNNNNENTTGLHVFTSLPGAVINPSLNALAGLVAGNRSTGTWAYGLGDQFEQNIWLRVNDNLIRAEDLAKISQTFELIGKIALRSHQLLESGVFETSTFFTQETETNQTNI